MEKMRVIGLLGHAGVGKDLAGKMLCEIGQGVTLAFADKLKSIACDLFGLTREDMYTEEGKEKFVGEASTIRGGKEVKIGRLPCLICPTCKSVEVEKFDQDHTELARCKLCGAIGDRAVFQSYWTPRTILQFLGTNACRRIDKDVWVRYAMKEARRLLQSVSVGDQTYVRDFIAITDTRFKSEATAIWSVGGEVWRIKRPSLDGQVVGLKGHASEVEQDSIRDDEVQAVIVNDGTLDDLRGKLVPQLERFMSKTKMYCTPAL